MVPIEDCPQNFDWGHPRYCWPFKSISPTKMENSIELFEKRIEKLEHVIYRDDGIQRSNWDHNYRVRQLEQRMDYWSNYWENAPLVLSRRQATLWGLGYVSFISKEILFYFEVRAVLEMSIPSAIILTMVVDACALLFFAMALFQNENGNGKGK